MVDEKQSSLIEMFVSSEINGDGSLRGYTICMKQLVKSDVSKEDLIALFKNCAAAKREFLRALPELDSKSGISKEEKPKKEKSTLKVTKPVSDSDSTRVGAEHVVEPVSGSGSGSASASGSGSASASGSGSGSASASGSGSGSTSASGSGSGSGSASASGSGSGSASASGSGSGSASASGSGSGSASASKSASASVEEKPETKKDSKKESKKETKKESKKEVKDYSEMDVNELRDLCKKHKIKQTPNGTEIKKARSKQLIAALVDDDAQKEG